MPITLDKTITRDDSNTIDVNTSYLDLNTKSAKIVEDIVSHVQAQLGNVEEFVEEIDNGVLGHVAIAEGYKNLALEYKNTALTLLDTMLQTQTEVNAAIANAGMDYPKVSSRIKADYFGIL